MKWTIKNLAKFVKENGESDGVNIIYHPKSYNLSICCVYYGEDGNLSFYNDDEEMFFSFDKLTKAEQNIIFLECLGVDKIFNSKEDEEKEFPIKGLENWTISRKFYHSYGSAMISELFSDKQMEKIASKIAKEIDNFGEYATIEDFNNKELEEYCSQELFRAAECVAIDFGMLYYEDLDKETHDKLMLAK